MTVRLEVWKVSSNLRENLFIFNFTLFALAIKVCIHSESCGKYKMDKNSE